MKIQEKLFIFFTAQFSIGISHLDVQLSCSVYDGFAFPSGHTVSYLCSITSVGHHQDLQLLDTEKVLAFYALTVSSKVKTSMWNTQHNNDRY